MKRNGAVKKSTAKQEYFNWLCDLIHVETGAGTYWLLARDLYGIEFVWSVNNDDNRAADGIALRERYLSENPYVPSEAVENGACTVLEMLIALAGRIDFDLSDPYKDQDGTAVYFWEMIENLGLTPYEDDMYLEYNGTFNCPAIIDQFMNREYEWNGRGGLFPLDNPSTDQREIEIWYQMNAYLAENYA